MKSFVAVTPISGIRIRRAEFKKMLRSEPDVALKILEELSRRLRSRPTATD